jgi:hypothetical protein
MRTRLLDVLPLRVCLLWGLLPGAGVSVTTVLLYRRHLGILGSLYAFLGFWAWWAISFAALIQIVSGAISMVSDWRRSREVRDKLRPHGYW